jgi:hypothetical protein
LRRTLGRSLFCYSHEVSFHLIDPSDKVELRLPSFVVSDSSRQSLNEFKILIGDLLAVITATNTSPSWSRSKRSEAIQVCQPRFLTPHHCSCSEDNSYSVIATVLKNRFTILSITGSCFHIRAHLALLDSLAPQMTVSWRDLQLVSCRTSMTIPPRLTLAHGSLSLPPFILWLPSHQLQPIPNQTPILPLHWDLLRRTRLLLMNPLRLQKLRCFMFSSMTS